MQVIRHRNKKIIIYIQVYIHTYTQNLSDKINHALTHKIRFMCYRVFFFAPFTFLFHQLNNFSEASQY